MKTILLVEDDPFLSSLLKNRLQKEGFEIILAKDGEEALSYLKASRPAIVLLDLILPKKTGFELMEEARSDPQLQAQIKDLPIIIISNLGQREDIAKGKELGAMAYFIKAEISIDELIQKVKEFLKL
ncbi:MAG: Response regulator receiver domain-containing protein [Candidatus Wolfebacteria bacterium GW2011_GWA2_42_10]|uniref:Response regulator receiver domain-containing protein n=2 Tax=Candidatus Wolfeibacteriota TaxID=1752735 RepID=A0A0G0XKJ4_9BACT|nr:MAG: Response regulator receiver domain-containing protein [Candidatus Wolfebacteria bacterium GW2011_GWB1_41_12]KKS25440.1 MAG: Response regulator receiver domain-containing protein [Candidatus Wolfebacteria bacterium GW2011_GWA2_42_10]KKT56618.1 MAG: Response regulator receiver domain-containing protein [Candidatus Wolfebacteria bacterium GW2011_GWA1_44_24]